MKTAIKEMYNQWRYGRETIITLINEMSDEELDRELPRKCLNTIRKHIEELIKVQVVYMDAIDSGNVNFENVVPDSELPGDTSKQNLLDQIENLETRLVNQFEKMSGDEIVNWFGEEWNMFGHLAALIGHEQMHIGQIIAFCYATDIEIPVSLVDKIVLSE